MTFSGRYSTSPVRNISFFFFFFFFLFFFFFFFSLTFSRQFAALGRIVLDFPGFNLRGGGGREREREGEGEGGESSMVIDMTLHRENVICSPYATAPILLAKFHFVGVASPTC